MALISVPDKSTGDNLTAAELNQFLDALKDGTRDIKPLTVRNPDSNGIKFYASDGTTHIATLDESGNLHLKGRIINL